ncbi:MAG: response regulator [Steroidobacteraceae bacterium]
MTMPPTEGSKRAHCPPIRILIVEDHVPTGQAIEALLHGAFGCGAPDGRTMTVATVRDAESALESVSAAAPDVVVMDISLPGMNGIEATRRLRDIAPTVPVIIHSRSDTDVYRAMAAEAGARAFVSKQDTATALPIAIRSILEEAVAG